MGASVGDPRLLYFEHAIPAAVADRYLQDLAAQTDWEQHRIKMGGREIACPRLSAWVGDGDAAYTYSGITLEPSPWTEVLSKIRKRVEALSEHRFNSVLLNLYRDGRDSMGWHADDEPELGPAPVIASVSLGAVRRFVLRPKKDATEEPIDLPLAHGSVLVMKGDLQQHWKHSVPKTRKPVNPRINLTFRQIVEVSQTAE